MTLLVCPRIKLSPNPKNCLVVQHEKSSKILKRMAPKANLFYLNGQASSMHKISSIVLNVKSTFYNIIDSTQGR